MNNDTGADLPAVMRMQGNAETTVDTYVTNIKNNTVTFASYVKDAWRDANAVTFINDVVAASKSIISTLSSNYNVFRSAVNTIATSYATTANVTDQYTAKEEKTWSGSSLDTDIDSSSFKNWGSDGQVGLKRSVHTVTEIQTEYGKLKSNIDANCDSAATLFSNPTFYLTGISENLSTAFGKLKEITATAFETADQSFKTVTNAKEEAYASSDSTANSDSDIGTSEGEA